MNTASPLPMDIRLMNTTAWLLFVGLVVFGALATARWVAGLPLFDIKGITVRGEVSHNNAATLRANVSARLVGGFYSMDLARVRSTFEAVPWVRRAVVRRDFPNRLSVTLQEHHAVAYWGGDEDLRLINNFGEVFEANVGEVEQEELPLLSGPEGRGAEVLAMYQTLLPLFERQNLPVDQLELSGGGSWRARLDTGASIELGRGATTDIVARAQRFLGTITQVTSRYARQARAVESADLRHENGYAVRLHGVSTTLTATPAKKK